MTAPTPEAALPAVPFTVALPGSDDLDLDGIQSVTTRADGTLQLTAHGIVVAWRLHVRVEQVTLSSVTEEDSTSAPLTRTIAVAAVQAIRLTGGWLAPRLVLDAVDPTALAGLPGVSRTATQFRVRVARADRVTAKALVAAITAPRHDHAR